MATTELLPQKQASTQGQWLAAIAALMADPQTPAIAGELVEQAVARVRASAKGRRAAFGWSGGKDSQALRLVCEQAGVTEAYLAISDLEFPEFLGWATDHMPEGLTIVRRPWDLRWLARHADYLFPDRLDGSTKRHGSHWFAGVQKWGRAKYISDSGCGLLILGRRRADGNHTGDREHDAYVQGNCIIWAPLAEWTHEDLLRVIIAFDLPLAPCYGWPRGYRVGTGSWPARQWCRDERHGWEELYAIDPAVVEAAADALPGAARYLRER